MGAAAPAGAPGPGPGAPERRVAVRNTRPTWSACPGLGARGTPCVLLQEAPAARGWRLETALPSSRLRSPRTPRVSPGVTSQGNHSPPPLVSGSPPAKPAKTHGLSQPGKRAQSADRAGEPAAFPAEAQAPGPAPFRGWLTRSSPRRPLPAPLMGLDAVSRLRADSGAARSGRGQRPRALPPALLGGVTCWPLSRLEGFRACPQPLAWPGGGGPAPAPRSLPPLRLGRALPASARGPRSLCHHAHGGLQDKIWADTPDAGNRPETTPSRPNQAPHCGAGN